MYVCKCVWVPLASLVSYWVSDYPMGALIELETLLIVSLNEVEGEGRKREQSGAARQGREGTTTSAEPGTRVSGADICTQLDLNITLFDQLYICMFLWVFKCSNLMRDVM